MLESSSRGDSPRVAIIWSDLEFLESAEGCFDSFLDLVTSFFGV